MNIGREDESLKIVNLLVRFDKTKIFPSVTLVLSILTTASTSASVGRVNSEEHVPKIPCPIPTASYSQKW